MRYLLYLERCSPSSIRISCDTRPLLSWKAERTRGSGELYCVRSLELGDPRAKWPTCSSISKRVREIHARASEPGWYIGLILVRDPEGYQISWIDHMVLGWSHFLASRSSTTGSNRHPPRHPPPLKTSLRLDADMLRLDTDILQYITQVMVFFAFPSCL